MKFRAAAALLAAAASAGGLAVAANSPLIAGDHGVVVRGALKGKHGVITGYRFRVDGEKSSRTFAPSSLKKVQQAAPPVTVPAPRPVVPSPSVSVPPVLSPPVAPLPTAGLTFRADATLITGDAPKNGGAWGMWDDAQHLYDASRGYAQGNPTVSVEVVNSPLRPGDKAYKFTNNSESVGGGRIELARYYKKQGDRSSGTFFKRGDKAWLGDILYVPCGQDWDPNSAHMITQLKQGFADGSDGGDQGSPPGPSLDLRNRGSTSNSGLEVEDSAGEHSLMTFAALCGRSVPIEKYVEFDPDSTVGYYEIWIDGAPVRKVHAATLASENHGAYIKEGDYGVGRGNVNYWHGFRVGTTRASVLR